MKREFIGERFGRLVVVARSGRASDGHLLFSCLCDCGNLCERQSNSLLSASRARALSSCGCAARALRPHQHGQRGSAAYTSWGAAKTRCLNPSAKDFVRYGAVGVAMCVEWQDSFPAFFEHMGPRPDGTTLDRIDGRRGYEPGNCRWATPQQQARNRKNSMWVFWGGERKHIGEVASTLGISLGAAYMRQKRGKLHAGI